MPNLLPMEYKLITVSMTWSGKSALEKLTKAVNEAIALGWEPLGGPVMFHTQFGQAMIKRR
jgi:hypothetical protein